jgi:hypothetical protein
MTVIISTADVGPGKIGYKNLFTTSGVTVTASTEESGFEKENAYDWFGYDWWKPTATGDSWIRASFSGTKTANYMAIWGHDLSDHGSSVKPQYSTDSGASWNDADSAVMPSNNNTLFITWDDVGAADWRLLATNPSTIASIAGVQIGEALEFPRGMPEGFAPPSLAPMVKLKTARSESGVFLGGSKLSEGIEGRFNLDVLDPAWVRDTWQPFIDYAQTPKPFVFAWDDVTHSSEVVLAWITKKVPDPSYSSSLYMQISLEFEGTL